MNPVITATLQVVLGLWVLSGLATMYVMWRKPRGRVLNMLGLLPLALGVAAMGALVVWLWLEMGRPPLRTLGETRLWYALLMGGLALVIEWRTGTTALRMPMLFFGILFAAINLGNPEAMDRTLMPALQSPWFVPHVVVYMAAYAALGLSCAAAAWSLLRSYFTRRTVTSADASLPALLVRIGLPMLTLGLVFGALWAKQAWGHYWTWDPKETWAFLTWAAYVGLIHLERDAAHTPRRALWLTSLAFIVLLGCWFALNALPAANASVHTYTQ